MTFSYDWEWMLQSWNENSFEWNLKYILALKSCTHETMLRTIESILIDSLKINSKEIFKLVKDHKQMQILFFSDIKFIINSEFNFGEMKIFKYDYYYKVSNDLNECEDNLI